MAVSRWTRRIFNIFDLKQETTVPCGDNANDYKKNVLKPGDAERRDFIKTADAKFKTFRDERRTLEQYGRMNAVLDTTNENENRL